MRCAAWLLGLLVGALSTAAGAATTLRPAASEAFWVTPDQECVLRWTLDGDSPGATLPFVLHDYQDGKVASGEAQVTPDGVQAILRPRLGFFDLEFPTLGQRFGVLALPPQKASDPFFAVDAALSWLVHDRADRDRLVNLLERSGIALSRERVAWSQIEPAAGQWQWDAGGCERLRQTYTEHGLKILEVWHDAPGWMKRNGKYPDDLVATAQSWQAITEHWKPSWGALELWNEPDISFSDNWPADQYVPVARAVTKAVRAAAPEVVIVGGVLSSNHRLWVDNATRNGLLDFIDAFSFHTYGRAEGMEALVSWYRDALAEHGHAGMPLWVTESGRPWRKGPPRPPVEADAVSALDVTMKAVEARACGVERYFPFVYPFYEEGDQNFSMLGRDMTPLRSWAAYSQAIRRLAGMRYLGDLTECGAAVRRARVFGNEQETVAVIYTGSAKPDTQVGLGLPVRRVEGIDGRPLPVGDQGNVAVPDGLSYVLLDRDRLGDRLAADTAAMRISQKGQGPTTTAKPVPPVVLRYGFDPAVVAARPDGYQITGTPPAEFPLSVRAYNLADQPQTLTLGVTLSPGVQVIGPAEQQVNVPASQPADVAWKLCLSDAFAHDNRASLTVEARGASADCVAPLVIDLLGEATLEQLATRFPQQLAVPLMPRELWTTAISQGGELTIDTTAEGNWRLTATHDPDKRWSDHWAFPRLRLPAEVDLSQFYGLVLRARRQQPGDQIHIFLWEGAAGYLLDASMILPDGQWHTALLPFSQFQPCPFQKADPNGQLDLDQVRVISVGLNGPLHEVSLEISDLRLVGPAP